MCSGKILSDSEKKIMNYSTVEKHGNWLKMGLKNNKEKKINMKISFVLPVV